MLHTNYDIVADDEDEMVDEVFDDDNDDSFSNDSFDDQSSSPLSIEIETNQESIKNFSLDYRKNLIYELISTEFDYINDLDFIIKRYMRKIKESALLNTEEFDLIFDQIENIYDSNRNFFDSLQQRLNASKNLRFCDILLEHLRLMYPYYQKFFMKQIIAMEVLQNRLDSDKNFATLLREITSETRIHLPLVSYLIKPMQRITKYPLLLEKIYKNTPSSHPDYKDCQEALNFSKKICININEACRRMECFNKLDWIQRKVSFSKHRSLN
ncbi:hypothetical protein SSS_08314 [Sarcoptes scabiei]|uniref:Intersectin-2 n=1 Tax=Sarcoptes scabiei TaxID=52283 RepID=A0A834RC95_SARSC|nr:hypothetical protein SSS_08314 [Sarcoptes scabiei]